MRVLYYDEENLFKDERKVDGFRISGVLAEIALKQTLTTNLRSLVPAMLPSTIKMRLDGRGTRDVGAYEEDRVRAVDLARHLRLKLHEKAFSVMDAVVTEGSKDHDLVLDEVTAAVGGAMGFISCELKCRRLRCETGMQKVRLALQKEECDESDWWQSCIQAAEHEWRGRMIILAVYNMDGTFQSSRADYREVGGEWRGVWGWGGSRARLPAPPQQVRHVIPSVVPRNVQARDHENFPRLGFVTLQGKRVAPLVELLAEMDEKTDAQPGREAKRLKCRHNLDDNDVFEAPRVSDKKGAD